MVPVPSETGASWGDLDEQYLTARFCVALSEAEYRKMEAAINQLKATKTTWHATTYNCNAFAADVARAISLDPPNPNMYLPESFIKRMAELNPRGKPASPVCLLRLPEFQSAAGGAAGAEAARDAACRAAPPVGQSVIRSATRTLMKKARFVRAFFVTCAAADAAISDPGRKYRPDRPAEHAVKLRREIAQSRRRLVAVAKDHQQKQRRRDHREPEDHAHHIGAVLGDLLGRAVVAESDIGSCVRILLSLMTGEARRRVAETRNRCSCSVVVRHAPRAHGLAAGIRRPMISAASQRSRDIRSAHDRAVPRAVELANRVQRSRCSACCASGSSAAKVLSTGP